MPPKNIPYNILNIALNTSSIHRLIKNCNTHHSSIQISNLVDEEVVHSMDMQKLTQNIINKTRTASQHNIRMPFKKTLPQKSDVLYLPTFPVPPTLHHPILQL